MPKGVLGFACSGCDASMSVEFASRPPFRYAKPITVGGVLMERQITVSQKIDLFELVPDGWVWPDPYTGACYCPECWSQIIGPEKDEDEKELENER